MTPDQMQERIIKAAGEHAMQTSEPDHECGDLIDWARYCWALLSDEQKAEVYAKLEPEVKRWLGEEEEESDV